MEFARMHEDVDELKVRNCGTNVMPNVAVKEKNAPRWV